MKTKHNWKIKIAFVALPILSLGMFALTYYAIWYSNDSTPFGVYVFLGVFGLLGMWTSAVALLNGKTVELTRTSIKVSRFFNGKKESILISEIDDVQNFIKSENPFINYELLVFRTTNQKEFWIVSYEFDNYSKIKKWLFKHSRNNNTRLYSTKDFLNSQYLKPLLLSIIILVIILIPLYTKIFFSNP